MALGLILPLGAGASYAQDEVTYSPNLGASLNVDAQKQGGEAVLLVLSQQDPTAPSTGQSEYNVYFNSQVLTFSHHDDPGLCESETFIVGVPTQTDTKLSCDESPVSSFHLDKFYFSVKQAAPLGRTTLFSDARYGTASGEAAPVTLDVTPATANTGGESTGMAFGAACGMVTIVAVPGSYETQSGAPAGVAKGMLADVGKKLKASNSPSIRTHYIAYPSTIFGWPLSQNYFNSKNQGYQATWSTIAYYGKQCPFTKFVLLGYSQGAHIAGDIAAAIDKNAGPVEASRMQSVRLLADPLRNPLHVPAVGARPGILTAGGIPESGIAGSRSEYDSLKARVTEYCAASDPICNFTPANFKRFFFLMKNRKGTHTEYASSQKVPGTRATFTSRIADDVVQDVVNLNNVHF